MERKMDILSGIIVFVLTFVLLVWYDKQIREDE